jgi:hypothetical protein
MPFIRLSSRLTFAYKLAIPLIGLTGLVVYVWLILSQHWLLELHGVIALFFLAMLMLFGALISSRIKYVSYNESFIQVANYGQPVLIPIAEYQLLRPALAPFGLLYSLRTSTTNSLFLSSISGTLGKIIQSGSVSERSFEPENVTIARKELAVKSRIVPE